MGRRTIGKILVVALLLQGCASTAPFDGAAAGAHQGPVQLFDADAKPRFNVYLACTSRTVNCTIIERAFDDWADMRHLTVHAVMPGDPALSTGKPSPTPDQAQPYRLAIRYAPEMAAAENTMPGKGRGLPLVSYVATVHVFDSATGRLLQTRTFHDKTMVDQSQGAANPYLKAQLRAFIGHLDTAYAKSNSAS